MECTFDGFSIKRSKFCDSCDHKKNTDDFRQITLTEWRKKIGKPAEKFRFEDLHNLVLRVAATEDLPPDKLSVKSAYLLSAYLREKNDNERIENWKREKESK